MSHSHEHTHEHAHEHAHEPHAHQSRRHDQTRGPHIETMSCGSASTIAQYLDELAAALRAGGVSIRAGERAVGMRVDGDVMLELHAEAGASHDSRVSLRLSWQAPHATPPPAPKLEISALRPGAPDAQSQSAQSAQSAQSDGNEQHSDMGQGDA